MFRFYRLFCALAFLPLSGNAFAQLAPPASSCFEVVAPSQGSELTLVMYNKCNGNSWILARTILSEATGNIPAKFTYRWRPLTVMQEGEAVLPFPNPFKQ